MKLFSFLSERTQKVPAAGEAEPGGNAPTPGEGLPAHWHALAGRRSLAEEKWKEAAQVAAAGIALNPDAYDLYELLLLAYRGSGRTEPKPKEVKKFLEQVSSGPWRSILSGIKLVFEENFQEAWAELSPLPEHFPGSRLFPAIRALCAATLLTNHRPQLEHPAQVRHRLQQDLSACRAADEHWSGAVKLFEEKNYRALLTAITRLFAERCTFPPLDAVEKIHLEFLARPENFDFSEPVSSPTLAEDAPPGKFLAAELFSFLADCQKAEGEFASACQLSPQFAKAQNNLTLIREQKAVLVSVLKDLRL